MSGFFVLDVPEFAPLLATARRLSACRVLTPRGGYVRVEFDGEVTITRADTGLGEAVWFGLLTAGLDGRIVTFDADQIRLAATNRAALHR